jgi:hypothetical protein
LFKIPWLNSAFACSYVSTILGCKDEDQMMNVTLQGTAKVCCKYGLECLMIARGHIVYGWINILNKKSIIKNGDNISKIKSNTI